MTAFKTLSARIRGAKAELEEMGEDTTDLVDGTSKIRKDILSLSGVDIMLDDNTFKSTYQILKEIAAVYGTLSDSSQAAVLEKIAGKNNANIVAAVLQDFSTAQEVMDEMGNSAGSASEELNKYLDSIGGKLEQLEATFQEIATNVLDSDFLKDLLDMLIGLGDVIADITKSLDGIDPLFAIGTIGAGIASFTNKGETNVLVSVNMPFLTYNNELVI